MADYTLSAKITGDSSKFTSEFNKAQGKIKEFDKSVFGMGKRLQSSGKDIMKTGAKITAMSAPVVMLGKDIFKTGMEFEAQMSSVAAIVQGTDKEIANLTNTAREMGATTRYSATEASEAMGFLALSGMNADQVIATIPHTLDFATAAGLELGRAAEIVAGNLNAFGLEAEDARRVTDVFAEAQANSAMDADQLASAMEKVAPMASSMGHEIEGTSALLGILANNEIKGARAGTLLSRVYKDVADAAEGGKIAIGEHSIEVFDANGNMRDMTKIVADVADATEGMTGEQKQAALSAVFQGQAMDALLPILNSGSEELLNLEEQLYNSTGAAGEMRDIMDDNMQGNILNMGSAFEELKLRLFDVSEGPMNEIISKITDVIRGLGELDDETLGIIMAIGGVIAVAGPLIMIVGALVAAVGAILSPIGLVTMAIMAVIGIGIALYKNWDTIREKAGELADGLRERWESIKESIADFLEPIVNWFSETWNSVKEATTTVWEGITNTLSNVWETITSVIGFGVELVKSIVEAGFTLLTTIVRIPLELVKAIVKTVWNYIGERTKKVWDNISKTVKSVTEAIRTAVSDRFNKVKDFVIKIWNNIKDSIITPITDAKDQAVNKVKEIYSDVRSRFDNLKARVSEIWTNIKTSIMNPINEARTTVSNTVSNLLSSVTDKFESIRSAASDKFQAAKDAITKPIESAKETISGIIENIKGFFSNLRLKFPKIEMPKLPKFSLSGKFSLKPPSVPRLKVNWNAAGAIFTKPTIFGNQGVGEAGPEAVLPIEKLGGIMADTMTRMGYDNSKEFDSVGREMNIKVELVDAKIYDTRDIQEISKELGQEIGREVTFA